MATTEDNTEAAYCYNAKLVAGNSRSITLTVLDEDGDALDLTGGSVVYVIKTAVDAATDALRLTSAAGDITISSNTATITISAGDTDGLAGWYYHQAQIVLADTREFTAFRGSVEIQKSAV